MSVRPVIAMAALATALGLGTSRGKQPGANATSGASDVRPGVSSASTWRAAGKNGAVAAGGLPAVQAGVQILKDGGNAADAAVATILALSVTDSRSFCFGGEVPIMIYDAIRGRVMVVAGQGAAPRLATREHFAARGGIPNKGIESAAVPAALDACLVTLDHFGTMTFAQVVAPTLRLLERETAPWHADLARTLRELVAAETPTDSHPGPRASRDRVAGLRRVADVFYRGSIARRIDAWSRENSGLIRFEDLASHVTRIEEPLEVPYRGYSVFKCGPWTQGPFLLESLQLLEGFDLSKLGNGRPEAIHVTVEAMKLALADRDTHYADPRFTDVPINGLLDPRYAALRRALIDMEHASLRRQPGDPLNHKAKLDSTLDPAALMLTNPLTSSRDTTTCVVADRYGNLVAATPSGWSGIVAGDTGVWLGSRLQSFNLRPNHPNMIEPGKRPRITLTPTIVLKHGKPVMAVSVAGGDNQDQMTLQLLLNHLDYQMEPDASVTAPRFMTDHLIGSFNQKPPALGQLRINPEIGQEVLDSLQSHGHLLILKSGPLEAAPCLITLDVDTGTMHAAGDPRAGRNALAY